MPNGFGYTTLVDKKKAGELVDDIYENYKSYEVCKYGIHGCTSGQIISASESIFAFSGVIVVQTGKGAPFCLGGDSGSLVWCRKPNEKTWNVLGILFLGDNSETYVYAVDVLQEWLEENQMIPVASVVPVPKVTSMRGIDGDWKQDAIQLAEFYSHQGLCTTSWLGLIYKCDMLDEFLSSPQVPLGLRNRLLLSHPLY